MSSPASNDKYRKSLDGVINTIYSNQKATSKKRNHPAPDYTLDEFKKWFIYDANGEANYKAWIQSGHLKRLKPSVDRINKKLPYTFDNIELVDWQTNDRKGVFERSKPVSQWKDNKCIGLFPSINAAVKAHAHHRGFSGNNISRALKTGFSAGGFCWKDVTQHDLDLMKLSLDP